MKPVVAIVGRPNVGKSTLFNRIMGLKKAIVEDQPGVTRDRNYADIEWDDKSFSLIDTGGFEPISRERIFMQMKEQCQLAIEEADLILFLMDGKDGLTPSDKEIASILRREAKPVLYIVNKIDGPKHEEKAFEFYGIGAEGIFSISAQHNYGVDDLMTEVLKGLPPSDEGKVEEEVTRVAVVGRPNVGKSSLINRILGYNRVIVNESPGTTRDAIDTFMEMEGRRYLLIDTAGIRRKKKISLRLEKYSIVEALRSIDRCDVALFLIDPREGVTEQDTKIAGFTHEKGKGCVIVVNKWDLIEKDGHTAAEYTLHIKEELKFLHYAPIIFISSLTGKRVIDTIHMVDQVAEEYAKRVSTSHLNDLIEESTKKVSLPRYGNRRVKIYYGTQASTKPPTFVLFANYPQRIHFTYQRYLINRIRQSLGFKRTPIRLLLRKRGPSRGR
ncbi:MAG: ribosome biogenesis GTPase Der [Syntrophobacterales bacterium]|nr:MAG: ribosome biogenesis GTPase Der [Syntrophobacterales bacterium]